MTTFKGMPSGKDYGTCLNWSSLDDEDFIVAFFATGNPFGDIKDDVFTWVVEAKDGTVVYLSNDIPMYRPVFGLDMYEWEQFKVKVLPIVDEYIEINLKGEK